MKRLYSGFVFMLVFMLIVGCQGNSNSTGSEQSSGDDSNKEQVTLKFWWPGTDLVEKATKELVEAFEAENPHINIEYEAIPWGEYFQKLSVGYAGGTAPDIHGLGFGQMMFTVVQDQYMNLDEFIARDNWDGKEDIFPDILAFGQYEDSQYGLLFPDTRILVYRKDFFKEAGLDPEQPPKTMDELFEYAEKLSVKDDKGNTVRGGIDIYTQGGDQSYYSLMLPQGMGAYDETGNPLFDSPESIAIVERVNELVKEGHIIPSTQGALEGSSFRNGKAAIAFSSSGEINILAEAIGYENIGFSLPPQGKNGDRTALSLGTFVTMNKQTKHADEAWEFIKYWFAPDTLLEYAEKTGFSVTRQSLKEEFTQLLPQNEVIFEAMGDSKGFAPNAKWNKIVEYLRLGLDESYSGIRPVDEALKQNADMIRQELNLK